MLRNREAGYTLVEVIVALGIFVTVATIATGALLSILKTQRTTFAAQSTSDQLRYFQDVFSRDIREGSRIACTPDTITISNDGNAAAAASDTVYAFEAGDDGATLTKNGSTLVTLPIATHHIICHTDTPRLVTVVMKFAKTSQWFQLTLSPRFPASIQ